MKVLNYSSINFWNELDNHLSLREIETSSRIEADVKSIIADIKKYLDDSFRSSKMTLKIQSCVITRKMINTRII